MKGWKDVTERQLIDHLAHQDNGAQVVRQRQASARRKDGAAQTYAKSQRQRAHPEHDEQVRLIQWVRDNEDRIAVLKLAFQRTQWRI